MSILRKQPWSPQNALDAVLADWPEPVPEVEHTLQNAEQRLIEACERFLKYTGKYL